MPQGATNVFVWMAIVGLVVLVFAAGSQGRARHLLLMLLGAAPRPKPREVLTATIPRVERDWSLVQQVAIDMPAAKIATRAPVALLTAGPDADADAVGESPADVAEDADVDGAITDEDSADAKPADEKPADEKPADEKPADEKPASDRARKKVRAGAAA